MDIKSRLAGAALGALLAMGIGSAGLAFAQSSDEPTTEAETPATSSSGDAPATSGDTAVAAQENVQDDTAAQAQEDTAAQAEDDATAQAEDDAAEDDTVNPEDCPEGAMGPRPGRGPGGAVPTPEAEADAGTGDETSVQL